MRFFATAGAHMMAATLLLAVSALPTQASSEQPAEDSWTLGEETREAWRSFKDFTFEQREKAVDTGEDVLTAVDRQLDALGERVEEAGDYSASAWEQREQELKALRQDLARNLDALGDASAEAYDEARGNVIDAYEATTDAMAETWNDATN